ncbi:MAG: TonB-dependent receptor plug domain-containing protein [Sphingomonas sp.]
MNHDSMRCGGRMLVALMLGCAWSGIASAQSIRKVSTTSIVSDTQPTAERDNDDVIVTGTRIKATATAAEAAEFGNNVQIVESEAIAASGASNFAEVAQFLLKGVNIGYSPDEGEYTIRLDGGGDRDTLVVLDNVPLYDRGPALETIWPATTIDPHMIDRVEVFRGGNSLFFGSNGGIGVVNIVTKRPDGGKRFELGASYGSFNSRELWGNASFPLDADGRHSVMFYGGSQQTDGPRIYNPADYVDNVAAGGGVQKFPLNRTNVGFKYLWKIDDKSEFRLNAQYTELIFQDAFPDTNTFSPNRVRYPIADLSLDRRWSDKLYTEFGLYWTNPLLNNTETFPDVCRVPTGCVDPNTPSVTIPWGKWTGRNIPFVNQGFGKDSKTGGFQEMGLNLRNTLNLKDIVEVVGGVQIVQYSDDSDPVFPIGDKKTTVTGLYIDVRPVLPFSPSTKISGAIRTDFISGASSRTIWKFGFRQPIGPAYIRANGGTSYSAPQSNERFIQTVTLVGNPDLKTETTRTFNGAVGVAGEFDGGGYSLEAGYFRTDIGNRIRATAGLTPNTYYNDEAVTQIRGITADVNFNLGSTFTFNLGFTKQQARVKGTPFQINETPEYFFQGGMTYASPDKKFHATLLPRYQGPEWSTGGVNTTINGVVTPQFRHNFGNYLVVNGSLAFWAGDKQQHKIQLRFVNILNEHYAERYGYGNRRLSEAFIKGQIVTNGPGYFYGYPFEGKPRSVFLSYTTMF